MKVGSCACPLSDAVVVDDDADIEGVPGGDGLPDECDGAPDDSLPL